MRRNPMATGGIFVFLLAAAVVVGEDQSQILPADPPPADALAAIEAAAANPRIPADAVLMNGLDAQSADNLGVWRTTHRCGINATYAYLKMLGVGVTYEQLQQEIQLTDKGAAIADLARACQRHSHDAVVVKATPETLPGLLPAIVHCEEELVTTGHYNVVVSANSEGVWLIDGTSGSFKFVSPVDFQAVWTGFTLTSRENFKNSVNGGGRTLSMESGLLYSAGLLLAILAVALGFQWSARRSASLQPGSTFALIEKCAKDSP